MLKTLQYLITLSIILESTSGLYFHIGETERKCFIEEIPDETTVLGNYYYYLIILIQFFLKLIV